MHAQGDRIRDHRADRRLAGGLQPGQPSSAAPRTATGLLKSAHFAGLALAYACFPAKSAYFAAGWDAVQGASGVPGTLVLHHEALCRIQQSPVFLALEAFVENQAGKPSLKRLPATRISHYGMPDRASPYHSDGYADFWR
jgi:hypothetical protein